MTGDELPLQSIAAYLVAIVTRYRKKVAHCNAEYLIICGNIGTANWLCHASVRTYFGLHVQLQEEGAFGYGWVH